MWSIAWHKWCSSVVGLYWWNWKSLVHCAKRVVQFGRRIIFDKLSLFQRRAWRIRAWGLCINYQRWAENTGLKGEIILPPVPKAELVQYPLLNSWWFLLHPSPHTTKSFKLASSQLVKRRAWRIRAWGLCINYQRWAENTGLKGEIILPPVPKAELVQYPLLNSWWFLLHPSPHTTKSFKLASSQLVKTEEKENALFSVPWEEPQPRSQGSLLPTLWSKRENR